jgi:sulfur carrier protein ThiS
MKTATFDGFARARKLGDPRRSERRNARGHGNISRQGPGLADLHGADGEKCGGVIDGVEVCHIVLPGQEIARAQAKPRETVAAFLRRSQWATRDKRHGWQFRLPTICVINGSPVLRSRWRSMRLAPSDRVEFLSRPMGGGSAGGSSTGKQVAGLIAIIALTALAPGIGTMAAGALGFAASTSAGAAVGALIGAGIPVGGAVLLDALAVSAMEMEISSSAVAWDMTSAAIRNPNSGPHRALRDTFGLDSTSGLR